MTNNEGGTDDEEFRNAAIVDRVNTTMAVWMGTSMACAQCHHHKYDPFSQKEYFRSSPSSIIPRMPTVRTKRQLKALQHGPKRQLARARY